MGNAATLISATRRSAVRNKINNRGSLASLGKEDYPNARRKLFGTGFEARLKARAETAQTLMDASSAGRGRSQNRFLFKGTSRPFRSSPYRGRGANRAFATAKQGVFNLEVSPPISGAGVNSGLLKHQRFKRRYVSSLFNFKCKQLSSSRKTSPLYSELVSYYKRPMGMSNNHRLPYRIHTNSCSSSTPTTPPLLRGGDSQSPSARQTARICKFLVHGSQERRGSKACHTFESPEQFCRVFSFQNGRDTHAERPFKNRRLHGQIGPQGCVFHRSSVGKPSKVSEISMEGHNVGIRLPSLWPSQCTESLHQTHETSGGDVTQNGRKTNSLPRRHFDNGRKQTTCKSTRPVSSQYTGKSRLCGEPREVSVDSFPPDGIPRFPSGFNNYDSSVTPRKSSQDTA